MSAYNVAYNVSYIYIAPKLLGWSRLSLDAVNYAALCPVVAYKVLQTIGQKFYCNTGFRCPQFTPTNGVTFDRYLLELSEFVSYEINVISIV